MAIFKTVVKSGGASGETSVGHATPDKLIDYLKYTTTVDGDKILRTDAISAVNAGVDSFIWDCRAADARFNPGRGYNDLKYKHYIQGFAPEDSELMTRERCHELGTELARAKFGDFPVLVVTHYEQDAAEGKFHWHNHLLVYNCAVTDGHKINTSRAATWSQKRYVAAQAEREGLTRRGLILMPNGSIRSSQTESYTIAEKYIAKAGQARIDRDNELKTPKKTESRTFLTQKAELRLAIRAAAAHASSYAEFESRLRETYGIKTKESRGRISFLHPDRSATNGWIRGRALGGAYEKEAIVEAVAKRHELKRGAAHASTGTERGTIKRRLADIYAELYGAAEKTVPPDRREDTQTSSDRGSRRKGKHL